MSDKNLNALKTLVISMGVVLILGFVTVGAAVWMKMKASPSGMVASNNGVGAKNAFPSECAGGEIDVKGRGQLVDTSVDGAVMRMAFTKGDQLELVHFDVCSGREIGSLKIHTDPQGMPQQPPMIPFGAPQLGEEPQLDE
jgi:hypothetical protein